MLDYSLLGLALALLASGELGTRSRDTDLHQVLAVGIGAGIAFHLALQWRWVVTTTKRFSTLPGRVRFNYLVGAFLLITFVATFCSGIAVSTWFSDNPAHDLVRLHHVVPKLFVLAVILHTLLHGRWLLTTTRALLASISSPRPRFR